MINDIVSRSVSLSVWLIAVQYIDTLSLSIVTAAASAVAEKPENCEYILALNGLLPQKLKYAGNGYRHVAMFNSHDQW